MLKPGDLVQRSLGPTDHYPVQIFHGISGHWHGIVIDFIPNHESHRPTKYHLVEVLLSSHGGTTVKTYLTDLEVEQYIEVLR